MEALSKLFGSTARIKLMRFFLFNADRAYDGREIMQKAKVTRSELVRELGLLGRAGFIKDRDSVISVPLKNGRTKKRKVQGWIADINFPLIEPLRTLLIDSELVAHRELSRRFHNTGKIKLLVVTGIFLKDDSAKVDLLVVGDKMSRNSLDRAVRILESEIGKDLRYVLFTPDEFGYRMNMYDSFLRDIFDGPHEKIINLLKIS